MHRLTRINGQHMLRITGLTALCALVAVGAFGQEERQTTMLHDCDSLEGISVSGGADWPETTLELSTDEQYVSQGEASVHLSGVSPADATGNSYLSVDFDLGGVDLTRKAILFDIWTGVPENTQALYVRAYNAGGQCVLSYLNWSSPISGERTTVELVRSFSDVLAWEQKMVESDDLSNVARLRFYIGTHGKGVPFDCYIDNIRMTTSEIRSFLDVDEAKPRHPRTSIVESGQPQAIIVAPDDDEWRAVADQVRAMVRDLTGAELPIASADDIDDEALRAQTAIVVGNVVANPRMLYLYSHGYLFADDVYPGDGGYEVRTVHDPWGTGSNALSIGASDPAGARAGITALRERLEAGDDLVLEEPLLLVELSDDATQRWGRAFQVEPDDEWLENLKEQAERDLETGRHTGLFGRAASVGLDYQLTRKDGYARGFVWLLQRAKEHRDTDPQTYGGPWGMDSDFRAYMVLPAWDVVEESPALTDEERLTATRVLFQWMQEAVVPSAAGTVGSTRVRHNHQTFPALGCMFAGEYFQKHYQAGEGRRWLTIADKCFQFQAQAFKPHEDCNGYQWLTLYHTLAYCLARPHFEYFDNGNAARDADYAIMGMDNLAYQVTYGDTGAYTGWWSEMPFLHGAEFYYRDGRYAWAINKKHEVSGRLSTGWYATDSEPTVPEDLIGAKAFPLDPHYYQSHGPAEDLPVEQTVDKVVFRNGFDPQDQYLLLDGLNNGGHHHYDGNSISRMTANGRIWIADASYMASLPKYHSTALILRDGQSEALPSYCQMEHMRDLPSVGFSETALTDYAGMDWHRNIFWLKGEWFLVADEMQAREAGDYSVRMLWHTIGDVELGEDGLSVEQQGQHCAIRMTPELRLMLEHDEEYGANWGGYEFIDEAVVHKMTGIWNGRLEEGEQVTLFTLLHPSGEQPSALHLTRLGPNQVAVTGEGADPTIVAVGGPDERISLAGQARIRGHAAVLRPGLLALLDAESLEYQFQALDLYGGQDVEMSLGDGDVVSYWSAGRTAEPSTQAAREYYPEVAGVPAEQVRGMIEAAVAAAPPIVRPEVAGADAPVLEELWSYRETLKSYLLTGNRAMFAAVDTGLEISAEPDPLPHNVFDQPQEQTNTVDNIVDGGVQSTGDCVMWDDDQTVTLRMDFDRVYEVEDIIVKAWFATSSSKDKLFQVQDIRIEASDDGFGQDTREIAQLTDTEMHGNWGAPGHAPHNYEFEGLDTHARNLRLTLTPREGTAIYIAEIEVRGTAEGIEEMALQPDSGVPVHSFVALHAADLDGDGADEIVAGSTNGKVYVFAADGSLAWTREIGGRVLAVSTARLAGHDGPVIVAGGTGATVFAYTPEGEELWSFPIPRYKGTGVITTLFPADLTGDGNHAVVAGTEAWRYYAVDAQGQEIWRVESVRKSTVGAAADLDGDGRDEVVAGTEYHWWSVYDDDGSQMWRYSTRTGPGVNDVVAEDVTGDGAPEVVFGGRDSFLHALSADGTLLWKFNTGGEVMGLAAVPAEQGMDLIVGSRSFNLYRVDGEGRLVWRTDLGYPVMGVAICASPDGERVAAVTEAGAVLVAAPDDGALVGRHELGAAGIRTIAADLNGDGIEEIVASSRDGNLTVLR